MPQSSEIWEAHPPKQLILAVSVVAALVTLDAVALGLLLGGGQRSPALPGAIAIAVACGQVAVAAIFFILGTAGFARAGLLLVAAVAYSATLLAGGATKPIRWDAACGELFLLAALVALPGISLRMAGLRLVSGAGPSPSVGRPWQFTLEGVLAALTASACLLAAIRWIATSQNSGVGVILEWLLLIGLPWICFALVALPLPPLLSFFGLWLAIAAAGGVASLLAGFLGRPALGLTTIVEAVVCAALLATLRWAGYRLRIAGPAG